MKTEPVKKEKSDRIEVKVGAIIVPIYPVTRTVNGKQYHSFTVKVADRHKIRPKQFTGEDALDRATAHARDVGRRISNGQALTASLTNNDIHTLARAREHLAPIRESVELACEKYAAIVRSLPPGVTPQQLITFWKEKHTEGIIEKTVAEVVTEFLEAKKADGLRETSLLDLTKRLNRFKHHFKCPIGFLRGNEIDDWLRGLKTMAPSKKRNGEDRAPTAHFKPKPISNRTRYNFRATIQTFCNYAKDRRYLPKTWDELDAVATPKCAIEKIEIFTPEEMQKLLNAANDIQRPFIALAAFAGIRHEELRRMDWSAIRFDSGHIIVNAEIGKVSLRRIVPILPNLLAWLLPHRNKTGKICQRQDMGDQLLYAAKKAGFTKWKRNALRHSFVSYRVAAIQNVAQTAIESGNSPAKIFSNYRELVTPADASSWFNILPQPTKPTSKKILKLTATNTAADASNSTPETETDCTKPTSATA